MGNRDKTKNGRLVHSKERDFIQNNRDSYKEETKIPPPHPQEKIKNINYFSYSKGSIFSLELSPHPNDF